MPKELITSFQGTFRFLSNFSPAVVKLDGDLYPTVEHAYQAAKTLDLNERKAIRLAKTPAQAKSLGKCVHLRPNWDNMKVEVMTDLLRQKFKDTELQTLLALTNGAELIEGNTWGDVFWGVCDGKGENWLGKLLMKIREEILSNEFGIF